MFVRHTRFFRAAVITDVHPECFGTAGDGLTNASQPNDTECLAFQGGIQRHHALCYPVTLFDPIHCRQHAS